MKWLILVLLVFVVAVSGCIQPSESTTTTTVTEITTTILYFSTEELKEFKALCKKGIKFEFKDEYQTKGNLSDLLLIILREKYGNL